MEIRHFNAPCRLALALLWCGGTVSSAFAPPLFIRRSWNRSRGTCKRGGSIGGGTGGGHPPPHIPGGFMFGPNGDDGDGSGRNNFLWAGALAASVSRDDDGGCGSADIDNVANDEVGIAFDDGGKLAVRGGSTKKSEPKPEASKDVIAGSKSTLTLTKTYWTDAYESFAHFLGTPVRFVRSKLSTSKEDSEGNDALEQLRSIKIRAVTAPNSTVLPPDVINIAAKRSGLLGNPLKTDTVQETARALKQWYARKGYILHSVTGATLHPHNSTAELSVQEPTVSTNPVGITFAKEMVVDDETKQLMTFRQYRDKHLRRKTLGHDKIKKSDLNTTFVQTDGRTNPRSIAKAMKLRPGRPFKWDNKRWASIARSGIFRSVLRATPQRMEDGSVQLHVVAAESPPRNLEYGITKSLYTGSWEGELDFEHSNLLGGGETLGLIVRRGARDAEPSVRLRYSDDRFGLGGGFDVELFNDYIGVTGGDSEQGGSDEDEENALLVRKGGLVRLRNPLDTSLVRHSTASAGLERTSTRTGRHENIGSATLDLGPFRRDLPLDARSNIATSLTVGTRISGGSAYSSGAEEGVDAAPASGVRLLPFTKGTVTTRQIFPLLTAAEAGGSTSNRRSMVLALQHSATTATVNLPRHEANAIGFASHVRGYSRHSDRPVSSSIVGTTELRIPVNIPGERFAQDGGIVIFGEWAFGAGTKNGATFRKSSVGIGLRKGFQGIPIKYDLTYTEDKKIRNLFGIGKDFDV